MKKYHNIEKISFRGENLILKVDGKNYSFKISEISEKLTKASKVEREKYEISPSGYGIHWPLIDEDLSIDGLLGVKYKPVNKKVRALASNESPSR